MRASLLLVLCAACAAPRAVQAPVVNLPPVAAVAAAASSAKAAESAPSPSADVSSVADTVWAFCSKYPDPVTVTFLPDGSLTMAGLSEASRDNPRLKLPPIQCPGSTWSQEGDRVVFDCNHFTIYEARVEGDRMAGQWHRAAKREEKGPTCLRRTPTTP